MLCTLDSACIVLCVLDPMYFSKGLRTEEPFAMLSGKRNYNGDYRYEARIGLGFTKVYGLGSSYVAVGRPKVLAILLGLLHWQSKTVERPFRI